MTQAEWLNNCQLMEEPLRELMGLARSMNISEPITIAINKDGMSWAQTHEVGHLYEFDLTPGGGVNVRHDRDSYFSKGGNYERKQV